MTNSLRITAIEGNRQKLDGGSMFGNAPRALWEKWAKVDEFSRIELACRCILVEWDGGKALFETGIGAFFEPKLASRFGVETPTRHMLLENLAACGVSPDEITFVVLSHLHFDHAGGLLSPFNPEKPKDYHLVFKNARFLTSEAAFARAEHPHMRDRASFIPDLQGLLQKSGRLQLLALKKGQEVGIPELPFVKFLESEGHTPGQMLSLIRGKNTAIFFCGDLIPGRNWLHFPITMGYDRFPELLVDEKSEIITRATKEGWFLFFTHDSEIAMARCQLSEQKVVPIDPKPNFLRLEI